MKRICVAILVLWTFGHVVIWAFDGFEMGPRTARRRGMVVRVTNPSGFLWPHRPQEGSPWYDAHRPLRIGIYDPSDFLVYVGSPWVLFGLAVFLFPKRDTKEE